MKDFDGFIRMNEDSNELALLSNLYSFYLQKYNAKEIARTKFAEQAGFLVEQGEVSKKSVKKFLKANGMTTPEVKVTPKTKSISSSSSDAWCGSSYDAGCGSAPVSRSRSSYSNSCGSSSSNAGC